MSKKKTFLGVLTWLGVVTLPYLIRKCTEQQDAFTGDIVRLNTSNDKSIGYYLLPGLIPLSEKFVRDLFEPQNYDFNLVKYGRRDYNLNMLAHIISSHIESSGYKKVRLITVGLGDHLLSLLDYTLSDLIGTGRVQVAVIDSLPDPNFLSERSLKLLQLFEPGLMSLRILSGWLAELPFIRFKGHWCSPAMLIEQLSSLTLYTCDYTQDEIMGCIKAVIKNGEAPYLSSNIDNLLDVTFNFCEDEPEEPSCKVFYNYLGNPGDLADAITGNGCLRVFKNLNWTF